MNSGAYNQLPGEVPNYGNTNVAPPAYGYTDKAPQNHGSTNNAPQNSGYTTPTIVQQQPQSKYSKNSI